MVSQNNLTRCTLPTQTFLFYNNHRDLFFLLVSSITTITAEAMAVNSNYDPLQPFLHSENELQDVLPSKELLPSPPSNPAYDQSIISDTHSSQPFLKPIIFQDCMWSGFNVDAELEEANATWMESAGSRALNMDYLQDLNNSLLQCIDPALIFSDPVEEKSKHSAPPRQHSHCSGRGKFMVILYKLGHYWVLFIELLTDVHAGLSMLYDQLEATSVGTVKPCGRLYIIQKCIA